MLISELALGAILDPVMQRGRFCVTGFLYDIFIQHSWRGFVALLIVISVRATGLAALASADVITPEHKKLAPLAVIVDGVIFGLGIVLVDGCASGTWYRSGEGLIGSWTVLAFYTLSVTVMRTGFLSSLQDALKDRTVGLTNIHALLGIGIWPLVIAPSALAAYLAVRYLCEKFSGPRPVTLVSCRTGLAYILAGKVQHVYVIAIIVGVFGVIAWPLSAAAGRNNNLGITAPPSNLANYVATNDAGRSDWGVLLVLGILVSSFIAAKISGEFRLRISGTTRGAHLVVGGICMGVDVAWVGNCIVGNGIVQVSLFSYQGWLALASIVAGVVIAAKLWLEPSAPSPNDAPNTPFTTNDTAANDTAIPAIAPVTLAATSSVSLPGNEGTDAAGTEASPLAGVFAVTLVVLLDRSVVEQENGKPKSLGGERYELDTVGAVYPLPLIEARDAIGKIEIGEELVIPFDCIQTTDTIPRWAVKDGREVISFEQTGEAGWTISVRRGRQALVALKERCQGESID